MRFRCSKLIPLEPLDKRDQLLEELSHLYSQTKLYPSDPALYEWEVIRTEDTPAGTGGFGDCFRGLFLGHHKVAMKRSRSCPDHVAFRRAEREMKVWKRLRHPHVLPFIGSVVLGSPSKLYMVSPWMDNGDLSSYLKTHADADCAILLAQIISGIEYLHTSIPPIVHGDLKAANVLISETGEACLADFGLSEVLLDPGEASGGQTSGNSTVWKFAGNPRWQAPELWDENSRRTIRSDIFAFGRVIFEVYMRDIPFSWLSDVQIVLMVSEGKQPPRLQETEARARGFDDATLQLMEWCCNLDAYQRPSASDVASRLHSALGSRTQRRSLAAQRLNNNPQLLLNRFSSEQLDAAKTYIDSAIQNARARRPFTRRDVSQGNCDAFDTLLGETMRTVDNVLKILPYLYYILPANRRDVTLTTLILRICILQEQQQMMASGQPIEYLSTLEELRDTRRLLDQHMANFRKYLRVASQQAQAQGQGLHSPPPRHCRRSGSRQS
ncbi:hypothetical protein BOTBODRAFT_611091 [Botryobasidium botryosum FD-172 SS1]|uniref:Protein kinase domain-containing protein n=1 Tax=Botryobasidium botryosum (strain FD-172 SS1) TaxID=930990 RepID=A0A067M711_BOTB1|nr:hypothetical protein BOTBODRAFT_611091 [Botryobasidium botryosum FD-172 SS1]